jgi:hypothetical protein
MERIAGAIVCLSLGTGLTLIELKRGQAGDLVGGRVFRQVELAPEAGRSLGLASSEAQAAFADKIRLRPATSIVGTFNLSHSERSVVTAVLEHRQGSDEELQVARRTHLETALSELRAAGIRPTMSADEFMRVYRDRYDIDEEAPSTPTISGRFG